MRRNGSNRFQSTPPVKAATGVNFDKPDTKDISIHAAREGGDVTAQLPPTKFEISIHAAREGGDLQFVTFLPQF